ncbi:MAG: C2 family cysteine protease [Gloeotrichia echinulata IR180]
MPVDNAGNTLGTARNLNINATNQIFTDWVGSTDTNDFYRFSLNGRSSFNLTVNGMSADADVQVIRDANNNTQVDTGELIASSTNGNSDAESIQKTFDPGTYYIKVYRYSGDTNYNLNVSATPLDNAGNSLVNARSIIVGATTTTYSDWIGTADTQDYYAFVLANNSNLAVTLNGLSADVNLQLQRLNADGTTATIASSTKTGTTAEAININGLSAGRYFLRAYQGSGDSFYNVNLSATTTSTLDWFSQNLGDSGIANLARTLAADGSFNRQDVIDIFRNAQDGAVIDANELLDLRTIVSNANLFKMEDYVRVLSDKVVNGSVANQKYQGQILGNLSVGSSATQMENLINKWFLGGDRPQTNSTSYTYKAVSGSLFQGGISGNDIKQGSVGDCYYLATLSSIAIEKPSYIQNMFIDNGDGTFTVRFYNNGVADYVTVDKYLPTTSTGALAYAKTGGLYNVTSNELWVALAEKAYAQLAESGWSRGVGATNSYASIEGGWMDDVIQQVANLTTEWNTPDFMTKSQLIDLVNSNKILTVGFVNGANFGVVNYHAYTVSSYNSTTGTFNLRNPWGYSDANVTWEQLISLKGNFIWSNS